MVPSEGSCHKKYTYEISILNGLKVMAKVKVFVQPSKDDTDADAYAAAHVWLSDVCVRLSVRPSVTLFLEGKIQTTVFA